MGDYTYSQGSDSAPYRMMLHAHLLHIPLEPLPLQARAGDPFLPATDPKWLPQRSLQTVEGAVEALLERSRKEEERRVEEERVKREEDSSRRRGRRKGIPAKESEEQTRRCEEWLREWSLD